MTALCLTTNPGLESVVAAEWLERAQAAGCPPATPECRPLGIDGQVAIASEAPTHPLAALAGQMRTIYHVMRHCHQFELPATEPLAAIRQQLLQLTIPEMQAAERFRVTTQRSGDHAFSSMDVQREAGAALVERYGKTVDLEHYDTEIRVDAFDRVCLVSVQLTRSPLDRRHPQLYAPRVARKTVVAHAMLRLSGLAAPQGRLLDPCCGSGTLLLEAAQLMPAWRCYGSDRDARCIAGARQNLEAAGVAERCPLQQLDARDLARHFPPQGFEAIVTNPPWGIRLGRKIDLVGFYRKLLTGAWTVLVPGGRLTLLVGRKRAAFNRLLDQLGLFEVRHARAIETNDVHPMLFVLERRDRAG